MTLRRSLTLLAVALTVTGGAVAAAETGQQQRSEVTLSATSWGYVDSATPTTAYYNPSGNVPIGTWDNTPHLQRSYVNFDLSSLRDVPFTTVLLSAGETYYIDCESRATEVWRTSAYSKRSTWQNRPAERTRIATRGPDGSCIDNDATFDVTAAVRDAVDHKVRNLTLGFRVAEAHEANPSFYRLIESPVTLRVVNNAPPATPTDLRTNGEPCADTGAVVSRQLELSARMSDPDGDDVFGQFAWWPVADPSQRSTGAGAGAVYPDTWNLADGTLTQPASSRSWFAWSAS